MFTDDVGVRQAERIVERLHESSATMAACEIRVLGGAMAGVPVGDTAFAHRQRRVMVNVAAIHDPAAPRREHAAWVGRLAGELADGAPGAYVGLLGDEGEARVRAAYPGATWDRLCAVKAAYDPENLFRRNHNIAPRGGRR
jgi:FAD/FMN-containing dehydrogenase